MADPQGTPLTSEEQQLAAELMASIDVRTLGGGGDAVDRIHLPQREIFGDKDLDDDEISLFVDLTQQNFLVVERELKLAGFWESIPARNKLKSELQKILLAPEFEKLPDLVANRAHIISRILEIADKNNDIILYAE